MKKSIHKYLLFSWGVSGCFVLLASLFSLYLWTQSQWKNYLEKEKSNLIDLSSNLSRQVSGELLLGEKGSPEIILKEFEFQNDRLSAKIIREVPNCKFNDETCFTETKDGLHSFSKIPYISKDHFLKISSPINNFFSLIDSKLILFAIIPLFSLIIIGIFIQRFIFRSYILTPIEGLVGVSTGNEVVRSHWPQEYQKIGNRLANAFEKREQAVYGKLARGVIHDIKTMIHSIMSASELALQDGLSPKAKEKRYSILARSCKANLPQMKEVIERTLDRSREILINKKDYDIVQTIKDTMSMFDSYRKSKSVTFKINIKDQLPQVPHDKVQLKRALSNVIQNSIDEFENNKFCRKQIIIALKCDKEKSMTLSVEDDGTGFKENPKNKKNLKSTKDKGSGLGLRIARKIIEGHGGKILLSKSVKHKGAKVIFELPTAQYLGVQG